VLRRSIVLLLNRSEKNVHSSRVNWPPNHPGGVALIKQKNKRLGYEPMTKHLRHGQTGQTSL